MSPHQKERLMNGKQQASPFPLRMPAEVKAHLEAKAEKEERSLNWLICKVLREVMERDQQIKQA
mgnify:CR=1 FL=1